MYAGEHKRKSSENCKNQKSYIIVIYTMYNTIEQYNSYNTVDFMNVYDTLIKTKHKTKYV